MIMSNEGCDDEGCKDRRLGEEDALSELIDQVAEPCLLLIKENYHEEISHLSPSGDAEQYEEEQNLPGGLVYDEYESDLGESQEEEKELEEQSVLCSDPISEKPPPEINEPTSVIHPPMLIRDIRPHVSNFVAEEAVCHQFSEIHHSFYDPVGEYMEWHFPYALEPPYFISTPACKEELKSVTTLLSRLHHPLMIIDRRKELLSRKLLEWLWWKFYFT
jgi:hypothetical protein